MGERPSALRFVSCLVIDECIQYVAHSLYVPTDPKKGIPLGMAISSHIIELDAPNTHKFNLSEKEICKQNTVLSFVCLSKSWIQKICNS